MAVKVMLAPVIAQREAILRSKKPRKARSAAKPKRRASSVYDADGREVFITIVCLKCRKVRPLSQFGLRKMGDGAIRNQPWCRTCRSGASAENRKALDAEESFAGAESSVMEECPTLTERIVDPGTLAAQVVAALHGGRR